MFFNKIDPIRILELFSITIVIPATSRFKYFNDFALILFEILNEYFSDNILTSREIFEKKPRIDQNRFHTKSHVFHFTNFIFSIQRQEEIIHHAFNALKVGHKKEKRKALSVNLNWC